MSGPTFASLQGQHVRLAPPEPAHTPALLAMAQSPANLHRWRFFGATVSAAEFERALWDRVLVQFAIFGKAVPAPVGLVQITNANFRHGTASVSVLLHEDLHRAVWPLEGLALALRYAFTSFPLRKIYAEMPEFNYDQIASGMGRHFQLEGRLTEHEWHFGRLWDTLILSVSADAFARTGVGAWLDRSAGTGSSPVLDLDGFLAFCASHLELVAAPDPSALLVDSDLDSLALLDLVLAIAELGSPVDEAAVASDQLCWRGLYLAYLEAHGAGASAATSAGGDIS